jgi:hypothetical protein
MVGTGAANTTLFTPTIPFSVTSGNHAESAAWGDFDNDGKEDLYLTFFNGDPTPYRLYHNNGDGTFTDVAKQARVNDQGEARGIAWGDYDNDGYQDLYLTKYYGQANRLFHNNGNGTFSEVAQAAGVEDLGENGRDAAWGDYDQDGYLDLLVANGAQNSPIVPEPDKTYAPKPYRLYHNNQDGTFTDVTTNSGVLVDGDWSTALWVDFDNDGKLDFLVATVDNTRYANYLWHNNGNGTFTNIAAQVGVADSGSDGDGRGLAFGDFDNDGDLDIFLPKYGGPSRLFRNNGNGTVTDVAVQAGVDAIGNPRGASWVDVDNDGYQDLFVAEGEGYNSRLYHNNGNGTFTDVAAAAGVQKDAATAMSAWADYDQDGDLDFFTWSGSSQAGHTLHLFRNNLNPLRCNYLNVRPLDNQGNFNQQGTIVRIFDSLSKSLLGTRTVAGENGYLGQNAYDVHFGVNPTKTYALQVQFPNGVIATRKTNPSLGGINPQQVCLNGGVVVVKAPQLPTLR